MKKFLFTLIVISILLTAGSGVYLYTLSQKNVEIDDEEVLTIIEAEYAVETPELIKEDVIEEKEQDPINHQEQQTSPIVKQPSKETITVHYESAFLHLQQQANDKIEQLLKLAYHDYQSGQLSYQQLYAKYNTAAHVLEQQTDQTFSTIYSDLQNKLDQHGYSKDHAQHFKDAYEQEKKDRRNAIVKKAMEQLQR